MSRKPNFHDINLPVILEVCKENGFEYQKLDTYHYRVYGATNIIDIWTPRMVYHIVGGENTRSVEKYHYNLSIKVKKNQVEKLLLTGKV